MSIWIQLLPGDGVEGVGVSEGWSVGWSVGWGVDLEAVTAGREWKLMATNPQPWLTGRQKETIWSQLFLSMCQFVFNTSICPISPTSREFDWMVIFVVFHYLTVLSRLYYSTLCVSLFHLYFRSNYL